MMRRGRDRNHQFAMISALSLNAKHRFPSSRITSPKRSSSQEPSRSESWAHFQRRQAAYLLISSKVMNCGSRWSLSVSWTCAILMADLLAIMTDCETSAENSSLLSSLTPRNWTILARRSPFPRAPSPARPGSFSESWGSTFSSCPSGSTSSGSCQSRSR